MCPFEIPFCGSQKPNPIIFGTWSQWLLCIPFSDQTKKSLYVSNPSYISVLGFGCGCTGNIQTSLAKHRGEPARRESRNNKFISYFGSCVLGCDSETFQTSGSFGIQADAGRTKKCACENMWILIIKHVFFLSFFLVGILNALQEPGELGGSSHPTWAHLYVR